MHAKLAPSDGKWHDLIVSCAVTHALEDVQVFHHHMAVQTDIKHLEKHHPQVARINNV